MASVNMPLLTAGMTVVIGAALFWAFGGKGKRGAAPREPPEAAPWAASQKKGGNSYYFAHQDTSRKSDGLRPEDYTMNGPRRLDSVTKRPIGEAAADDEAAAAARPAAAAETSRPAAPPRTRIIDKYSWSDTATHVTIYVDPPGWDWTTVASDDVRCDLSSSRALEVRVVYGGEPHALLLTRLSGDVSGLVWKKTKKRLTVTLAKRETALAWDKAWTALVDTGKIKQAEEAD
ncbi:hypothetical protein M885DRAFT_626088 [Pelagophyceae sp. CCMP2097]|nr:hypothetical protein M885DRAFT_626088 [Pelagophyceae sp. CCMP2097]